MDAEHKAYKAKSRCFVSRNSEGRLNWLLIYNSDESYKVFNSMVPPFLLYKKDVSDAYWLAFVEYTKQCEASKFSRVAPVRCCEANKILREECFS